MPVANAHRCQVTSNEIFLRGEYHDPNPQIMSTDNSITASSHSQVARHTKEEDLKLVNQQKQQATEIDTQRPEVLDLPEADDKIIHLQD